MYSFIEACVYVRVCVNLHIIVFLVLFYNFKALISIEIQNLPPTFDKYFVMTERKQVLEPDKLKN